jgi:hypothetical protein
MDEFDRLVTLLERLRDSRDVDAHLLVAVNVRIDAIARGLPIPSGAITESQIEQLGERFGGAGESGLLESNSELAALLASGGGTSIFAVRTFLESGIDQAEQDIVRTVERLTSIDPLRAIATPGVAVEIPFEDQERIVDRLMPAAGPARLAPTLIRGPEGALVMFDPNTNQISKLGTFAELADRPNLQIINDRQGNLIAVDPGDPTAAPVVLIEGFGFPEIDPEVLRADTLAQFEQTIAVRRQEVANQFVGLELQRRGQMIEALGQDMANQVAIEMLPYEEARINLERMSVALDKRREEREVALAFAVKRTSLVERDGETLTRLPFAEQLQAALEGVTGADVDPRDFELPTDEVNPNEVARKVLEASTFTSPVPRLRSALDTTRQLIQGITGAPIGTSIVARSASDQIVEGLDG